MRHLGLRTTLIGLVTTTVAIEIVAVVLSWGLEAWYDTLLYAVCWPATVGAGALILTRYPRHPVGWLLCANGLVTALTDLAQGWGLQAAALGWPGGPLAEWIVTASWLPGGPVWILTVLLFPDGRMLGQRWWAVVGAGVVGTLLAEVGWTLDPDTGSEFVGGRNPFAAEWLPTDLLFGVGFSLLAAAMVLSVVPLVLRFRRSQGIKRQQLKWFAVAASCLVIGLPMAAVLWKSAPATRVLPPIVLTAQPLALCVAILRYRLYDIDLLISRAIAYAILSLFLAAAYAGSVVGLGTVAGQGSGWATAGATLAVAVLFRPLRDRVQARVDRRFRRTRYEALRRVSAFLETLRTGRSMPEAVEGVLQDVLGDPSLELRLLVQEDEPYVDIHGQPIVDAQDDGRGQLVIAQGGVVLGMVVYQAGTEEQNAFLPSLVDAARLAIEMARLRVELRRHLAEVEASRARLVTVADEERRRIERDLHDGAQQRLVSIGLALRHAQHTLGQQAPEASRVLDGAVAEISVAIDELRELARGLRPALLDAGLGPALRELASRAPLPVAVLVPAERFAPELETTAYFVACEGLTNTVKHAHAGRAALRVARQDSSLVVTVTDDGVGGATATTGSGLSGLADRVAARGGRLRIETARGHGTTLVAELPLPCA